MERTDGDINGRSFVCVKYVWVYLVVMNGYYSVKYRGSPMNTTNIDILNGVRDVIIDEDGMWIISDIWNCFFKYNFSSQKLNFIAMFPESIETNYFAFSRIIKLGNEIFFIPSMAKDIYYYNLDANKFGKLNIDTSVLKSELNMGVVIEGDFIYCINRSPDVVFQINAVTKESKMFWPNISQYINKKIEDIIYTYYWNPCCYDGKIIWSNYNNLLTIFDIKKECFYVEKIDVKYYCLILR